MKTILACLGDEQDARDILRIALPFAERHGSHLIGAHVQEHVAFYPGVAVHVPAEIYVDFQQRQAADSEAVKAVFEDLTRTATCATEWRLIKAGSPDTATALLQVAYTADLVLLSQTEYGGDQSSSHYMQESVIRGCGRPVLFVPAACDTTGLGKKVVVGWSPTREAARAAHDVIPLLDAGAEVIIATVSKAGGDGDDDTGELARMFDRHGFKVDVVHRTSPKANVAEELSGLAFERGADMIATGAFGHSRLHDFVIGAVTLDLMRHARMPVLFSK